MKKKNNFDKKFPLFVKYVQDPTMQINMVGNAELVRKYEAYSETIDFFLRELDKRFDKETVKRIIIETIIKLPDTVMSSLITAYLNSKEEAKSNPDFISYYNKTSNMGIDAVQYIEKNGITTSRTYKEIPEKAIDARFEEIRSGAEQFNGEGLSEVYKTLDYNERKFVISLIEAKIVEDFDVLFEKFNFSFKSLISILMTRGIDSSILSKTVYTNIGGTYLLLLVCLFLDDDNLLKALPNVKRILNNERFELIKSILNENLLSSLSNINLEDLSNKEDSQIIEELKNKN